MLRDGWLMDPKIGKQTKSSLMVNINGKFSENDRYNPNVVCFCDIPVGDLEIHMKKYSPFGLSFLKSFLVGRVRIQCST